MDEVVLVNGDELSALLDMLDAYRADGSIFQMFFAIDGGLKVKVNAGVWSAPMGGPL